MGDVLLCSTGLSLFTGLGVSATVGTGAGAISLVDCGRGRFSSPSAARAPAIRICSSVGTADPDFSWRDLGLAGSGASDSEGLCSEDLLRMQVGRKDETAECRAKKCVPHDEPQINNHNPLESPHENTLRA